MLRLLLLRNKIKLNKLYNNNNNSNHNNIIKLYNYNININNLNINNNIIKRYYSRDHAIRHILQYSKILQSTQVDKKHELLEVLKRYDIKSTRVDQKLLNKLKALNDNELKELVRKLQYAINPSEGSAWSIRPESNVSRQLEGELRQYLKQLDNREGKNVNGSLNIYGNSNVGFEQEVHSEAHHRLFELSKLRYLIYLFFIYKFISWTSNTEILMPSRIVTKPEEDVDTRFSDVIGCDEAREELEEVIEFLRDPSFFEKLGGKLPKGVLLIGPPGTGKTLLAKAVAGEADVPFFSMAGSEFNEIYVGVGPRRVRELFAAARKKAPCVVFIDEIDAIGGKRMPSDTGDPNRATINQLLAEMDGFASSEGIIVIGATNIPSELDKALTRPGRFDKHVTVSPPDVKGRTELFQHYLAKTRYRASIDPSLLARGTTGATGATIMQIVNEAAVRAAKLRKIALDMKDLDWAKDKVLIGAERKLTMSEDEKLKTAYHEGGHTLVGLFTNDALPLYKVTILPRGQALGITFQLPEQDIYSMTRDEILAQIDVCMGGRVAEELKYGANKVGTGASNDFQKATQLARDMVEKYGMSDKFGPLSVPGATDDGRRSISRSTAIRAENETKRLLKESYDRVKNLLSSHLNELDRLASQLVVEETLTDEQVRKLLNIPRKKKKHA